MANKPKAQDSAPPAGPPPALPQAAPQGPPKGPADARPKAGPAAEKDGAADAPIPAGPKPARKIPDPTRYGDWEKNGRCIDF